MTEKEIAIVHFKLKTIWKVLSKKINIGNTATKLGFRYLPTKHYIKLAEYLDGLTYLYWFEESFPNDSYTPNFLFEWTIILFKTGNINGAEKKAFLTYCLNCNLFESYFKNPVLQFEKLNLDKPNHADEFQYSSNQIELTDFTNWLTDFISTRKFKTLTTEFNAINSRLKTEEDRETRNYLFLRSRQLVEQI